MHENAAPTMNIAAVPTIDQWSSNSTERSAADAGDADLPKVWRLTVL